VALERETIERKDFPIGRRGYDPAAVDAHLSTIADEVETLKQISQRRAEPVAGAISEQVRGIVEAAERGAAEIQARAQQEARELRSEATQRATQLRERASQEAAAERERAAEQSREYLGRVSESTSQMLERLGTIDGELNTLTDSLRAAAERVRGELERLQSELGELRKASAAGPGATEEAVSAQAPAEVQHSPTAPPAFEGRRVEGQPVEGQFVERQAAERQVVEGQPVAAVAEPAHESAKVGDRPPEHAVPEAAPSPPSGPPAPEAAAAPSQAPVAQAASVVPEESPAAPAPDPTKTQDNEGARLIALNMALDGAPREETARYLAENFTLQDRESLLDEVYASVGR
jgi:DivIVA domain-containing protein